MIWDACNSRNWTQWSSLLLQGFLSFINILTDFDTSASFCFHKSLFKQVVIDRSLPEDFKIAVALTFQLNIPTLWQYQMSSTFWEGKASCFVCFKLLVVKFLCNPTRHLGLCRSVGVASPSLTQVGPAVHSVLTDYLLNLQNSCQMHIKSKLLHPNSYKSVPANASHWEDGER